MDSFLAISANVEPVMLAGDVAEARAQELGGPSIQICSHVRERGHSNGLAIF